MKKTIIFMLVLTLLLSLSFNSFANSKKENKNKVIVFDAEEKGKAIKKYIEESREDKKLDVDTTISVKEELLDKYDISITDDSTISVEPEDTIAINEKDLYKNKLLLDKVNSNEGNLIYIYGNDIDIDKLNSHLKLESNDEKAEDTKKKGKEKDFKETKWDVVGICNGEICYFGNINSFDFEGNKKKKIEVDTFIDRFLSHKESLSQQDNEISTRSIVGNKVKSEYNLDDTLYRDNAWGDSILRAELNADYVLYKDTEHDDDDKYDYFYITNNVQIDAKNDKGCSAKYLEVDHSTRYSSDEIEGWGPEEQKVSGSEYITVGLPWSVSYTFFPNQGYTLDCDGSLRYDEVHWKARNKGYLGDLVFEDDQVRIKPGTAWASTGTLAAMDIEDTATVQYGNNTYTLEIYKGVKYDY